MKLPQYKIVDGIPVFTHALDVSIEEFECAVNLAKAAAPSVADGVENYLRHEMWKTQETKDGQTSN